MFVLDYSGSMGPWRESPPALICAAVNAMKTVLTEHINDCDYVAFTLFNNKIK
jgi:hypothetical protein